jgi:type IV pilus assembly protein PilZ
MSMTGYIPTAIAVRKSAPEPAAGFKVLRIRISNEQILNSCYMPFLRNRGIFIPGLQAVQLTQRVFLILSLPDLPDGATGRFGVLAHVAWITPVHAEGSRTSGAGLHFENPPEDLQNHIETLLNGLNPDDNNLWRHTL